MTNEQYLVSLVQECHNAQQVLECQKEYRKANGGIIHLQPIGGFENNSFSMENMEKVTRAQNETVTNGFDSVIQLYRDTGRFKKKPKTPAEAQAEIAAEGLEAPGVYVFTSSPPAKHSPKGGRPKHLANVETVDEGVGIPGDQFAQTIVSIGGSNKVSNPLSLGTYGQGCKALLGFSNKGVALIVSRYIDDPEHIYFTVTSIINRPDWKASSYQWQHDGNGNALRARVALLPPNFLINPREVKAGNVRFETSRKLILGDHGLSFKAFELEDFSSPLVVYNQFRENNFGIEIPLRYRNGVAMNPFKPYFNYKKGKMIEEGRKIFRAKADFKSAGKFNPADWEEAQNDKDVRNIYNIIGLRYRLLNDTGGSYPVRWSEVDVPILHDQAGNAQATISVWYLEEVAGKEKKTHDNLEKPIWSVLSTARRYTPVFVTMHGQTHLTLPTLMRLRAAELPYLEGHLIIEVKCDIMSQEYKRQMFTSNREGAKEGMRERLNEEIESYLKERAVAGASLRIYHDLQRTASASKGLASIDMISHTKRFLKLLKTTLAGSLFSSMGIGGAKRRSRKPNDPHAKKRVFNGKTIPDEVSVIGKISFEPGQKRYLSVGTNAINAFDTPDANGNYPITLDLPPFLKALTRMPIDNGRVSYRVECDDDVAYGTTGTYVGRVSLPDGSVLEDSGTVTVEKEREVKEKGNEKNVLNPKLQRVEGKADALWSRLQAPDGASQDDIAFAWEKVSGDLEVPYNTKFKPYLDTLDEINKKWRRETGLVERFKADYAMAMQFLAFAEIDAAMEAPTTEEAEKRHAMRAAAAKVQAFMLFMALDAAMGGKKRGQHEAVVEIEAAEQAATDQAEAA